MEVERRTLEGPIGYCRNQAEVGWVGREVPNIENEIGVQDSQGTEGAH